MFLFHAVPFSYSYDSLNQLTSFQRGTLNSTHTGLVGSPSHSQSWTPDALGNFTGVTTDGSTQARTANQQNEYTSISGSGSISYDANGNTTADGSGDTFVYDAWNELVAVKSGGTTVAAYGYNGLGERTTEMHGSTATDLYYSAGWQVLEERQGGQVQARNVWSPAGVDTLVLRDQSSQHNGTLDQRLYAQQDANGDVTALVGTTGSVLERYAYDPYGQGTVLSPNWVALGASAYGAVYLWQGKRYDATVGLYDSRGRAYSPTLMRPMQADPLGLRPDVNDYRWECDGPLAHTDPSGLGPDSVSAKLENAIASGNVGEVKAVLQVLKETGVSVSPELEAAANQFLQRAAAREAAAAAAAQAARRQLFNWSRRLGLNANSATTQTLYAHRAKTVQEYLSLCRQGSVKEVVPTEALTMTVEQALRAGRVGGRNIGKLLKEARFCK